MHTDTKRYVLTTTVLTFGGLVLLSGTLDVYQDAVVQRDPVWTTLAENLTSVLLGAAVVLTGRYVLDDATAAFVDRAAWWLPRTLGVAALAAGWVLAFQSLQSKLKPAFLATDLFAVLVLAAVAIATYDTRQRERARELKQERDKFSALFENIPTPVVAVSSETEAPRIELVNPAFEERFGLSADDLAGTAVDQVLQPPGDDPDSIPDSPPSPSGDHDDSAEWRRVEVTLETDRGKRDFLRIGVPVELAAAEQDEFVYFIDVTERKQREEQLRVMSRTLRHDLRNKMTVVEGNASALRDRLGGEREQLSRRIESASEELLAISEQTREVERIISGEDEPAPTALADHLDAAVADARDTYPDAAITIVDSPDARVQATDALETAIYAVLENAVEHNDTDAPTVDVTVTQSLDGDYVDVSVADDGPGIPPHEYELVTGDAERTQLQHSSGLGLWVVNWIVTNYGGELQFDANAPRGSVVTLRLRRADD